MLRKKKKNCISITHAHLSFVFVLFPRRIWVCFLCICLLRVANAIVPEAALSGSPLLGDRYAGRRV